MSALSVLLLATGLSMLPAGGSAGDLPRRIDVDCGQDGALQRALDRAGKLDRVDIHLYGMCAGGVVIPTDGVTLRGGAPGSGLEATDASLPVLVEIRNANVALRDLDLRGGEVGALADGSSAEVLLVGVDLAGQSGGVFARDGAEVRILDSSVRDGEVGVLAQSRAVARLQDTLVSGQDSGVAAFDGSRVALTDTVVEHNRTGGLQVDGRSEAFVSGGAFRENGQVHVYAGGRSDVTLGAGVVMGSESDSTGSALGVGDHASIASFNTPALHGDLTALDRGSLRIGNAVIHGDLLLSIFSDALVSNSAIEGIVFCDTGSDAICSGTASAADVIGCPSPTCGGATGPAQRVSPSSGR